MRLRTIAIGVVGTALGTFAYAGIVATSAATAMPVTISVPCSVAALRTAVNTANVSGGATLNLATGCVYTIVDVDNTGANGPNGLPVLTSAVTVAGNGATVARSSQEATPDLRFFELAAHASLSVRDLTLRDGLVKGGKGGAIHAAAGTTLSLTRSNLSGNATPNTNFPFHIGFGGGVFASGVATVDSTTFSGNGDTTQDGGAFENFGGQATLTNCTFRANQASTGGALHSGGANGSTHVIGGVFEANRGGDAGGAVENDEVNTMDITGTSFRNNFVTGTGADLFNGGTLTVAGAHFAAGSATQGGAIFNGSIATVISSDMSGAFGISGGAIKNRGLLDLRSSSLSGNQSWSGGGLFNDTGAVARLDHVAIRANAALLQPNTGTQGDGGGIYNAGPAGNVGAGSVTLVASQVVGNRAAHDGGGAYNAGVVAIQSGTTITANTPNNCVNRSGGTGC